MVTTDYNGSHYFNIGSYNGSPDHGLAPTGEQCYKDFTSQYYHTRDYNNNYMPDVSNLEVCVLAKWKTHDPPSLEYNRLEFIIIITIRCKFDLILALLLISLCGR